VRQRAKINEKRRKRKKKTNKISDAVSRHTLVEVILSNDGFPTAADELLSEKIHK